MDSKINVKIITFEVLGQTNVLLSTDMLFVEGFCLNVLLFIENMHISCCEGHFSHV